MPLPITMDTPDQCCTVGQHLIGGYRYYFKFPFDSFTRRSQSPRVLHAVGSRRCNGSFPSLGKWTSCISKSPFCEHSLGLRLEALITGCQQSKEEVEQQLYFWTARLRCLNEVYMNMKVKMMANTFHVHIHKYHWLK